MPNPEHLAAGRAPLGIIVDAQRPAVHGHELQLAIAIMLIGAALAGSAHSTSGCSRRSRTITRMTATTVPRPPRTATVMPTAAATHTSLGLDNRKIAIWTFIGSECMLFASLISTYLIYKGKQPGRPVPARGVDQPDDGRGVQADPEHPGHLVLDVRAAHVVAGHGAGARRGAEPPRAQDLGVGQRPRLLQALAVDDVPARHRRSSAARPTSSRRSSTKG